MTNPNRNCKQDDDDPVSSDSCIRPIPALCPPFQICVVVAVAVAEDDVDNDAVADFRDDEIGGEDCCDDIDIDIDIDSVMSQRC